MVDRYHTFEDHDAGDAVIPRDRNDSEDIDMVEMERHKATEYSTESMEEEDCYSEIGEFYRRICFSPKGIKFSILLNGLMVTMNSALIIYEFVLMAQSRAWTVYYDLRLPLIYSLFDVALTVILSLEISLHLTAIYRCHICHYFRYSNSHKVDVLIFVLSLMLCIFVLFDVFPEISDMDNMGFLMLRIIRDIMRFVRCIIFTKILYDSIVQLNTPKKRRRRRWRDRVTSGTQSTSCSSGWDQLRASRQEEFVCL